MSIRSLAQDLLDIHIIHPRSSPNEKGKRVVWKTAPVVSLSSSPPEEWRKSEGNE